MTSAASIARDQHSSDNLKASVRQAWESALERPVPDDGDFFALGGNSLTAISISASLERLLQVRLRLRLLFDHPHLESYVREVTRIVRGSA